MKYSSNADKFVDNIEVFPELYERQFRKHMYRFIRTVHEDLMARTPVHTGLTVRNWIVTHARPESGYYEEEKTPLRTGQTGRKQERGDDGRFSGVSDGYPLGSEPRRAANEREARRTRESVDLTNHPYKNVFITNNAPDSWNVEMGRVPERPYIPRSKGMLELSFADLIQRVEREYFA